MCSILKTIGKIQPEYDYPVTKENKDVKKGSGKSSTEMSYQLQHFQNETVTSTLVPTHMTTSHHHHPHQFIEEQQQQQQIFRPASLRGRFDTKDDNTNKRTNNNHSSSKRSQISSGINRNVSNITSNQNSNNNMIDLPLVQYHNISNAQSLNDNSNHMSTESPMFKTDIEMITNTVTPHHADIPVDQGIEDPSTPVSTTTIHNLYPEILTEIFLKLPIKDLGNVARSCQRWRQILYDKILWRDVEAKIHLRKSGNQLVYQTLNQRGIKKVQVLSLKRSLRELTTSLPHIQSLKLVGCYNVTDISINSTFSIRLENLKILNLSLCKQVSDFSIGRIATMAVNLESLELGGCCQISNRGLLLISWGLKKLNKLNLRSCYLITDTGIGFLSGLVTSSHLQEPKMQDFLSRFGLVNGPQQQQQQQQQQIDCIRNNSNINMGMNSTSQQQQQQLLYLQNQSSAQVPMLLPSLQSKKSRLDNNSISLNSSNNNNNTNLSVQVVVPIQQQCAICKQDISMIDPNNTGRRKRSRAQILMSSSSSNNNNNNNNSNNNSIHNISSDNNRLIMNHNSNNNNNSTTTTSVFTTNPVEKITSKTEFGCKNLQVLNLQDCQKLSDETCNYLTNLPKLETINLSFCVHVSDQGLKNLGSCPKLKEINLRACDNISDQGLMNLSYDIGTRISLLDVSFCDKIGNPGLNYVAQFHNLKTLSMSACDISDEGLNRIASSIPNLETLNIGQCSKITDLSIQTIAEKCKNLKYVDLYGCCKVSPKGLASIMTLPKLENLNLGLWHLR